MHDVESSVRSYMQIKDILEEQMVECSKEKIDLYTKYSVVNFSAFTYRSFVRIFPH